MDILIGPLSGSEGIAVAEYSKSQPDVTFVNGTSGAQDTTLKVQSPNFFRWNTDGAQWMAGLGDYAYNELGWRNVVTLADDYDFPYTQVAGFVAEFCSLGGNVEKRIWPPLGEEDYSSYIQQIPDQPRRLLPRRRRNRDARLRQAVRGAQGQPRGQDHRRLGRDRPGRAEGDRRPHGGRRLGIPTVGDSHRQVYTSYIEDFDGGLPGRRRSPSVFLV